MIVATASFECMLLGIVVVANGQSHALAEPEQHGMGSAGRVPAHHVPGRHPVPDIRRAAPQDRRQVSQRVQRTVLTAARQVTAASGDFHLSVLQITSPSGERTNSLMLVLLLID